MPDNGISVQAAGLTRTFGKFVAVDHIDLSVRQGEIFGFLGPNGAGKSTTIKMFCGILLPTSGQATVGGFDIARQPRRIREIIGYMSQKFSLYEDLTVDENLNFFGGVQTPTSSRMSERKSWAIEMARLTAHRKVLASDLPGGLRQRLALACATIHEPRVLFLDEPTAGVDPAGRLVIREVVRDLRDQGVAVLLTTHELEEAARLADRVIIIDRGAIVAEGTPSELMSSGGGSDIRFGAPPGIDTAGLAARVDAAVVEEHPGEYRVDAPSTPERVASLTAWLAEHDLPLADLRAGRQSLEDVFLRLTGEGRR